MRCGHTCSPESRRRLHQAGGHADLRFWSLLTQLQMESACPPSFRLHSTPARFSRMNQKRVKQRGLPAVPPSVGKPLCRLTGDRGILILGLRVPQLPPSALLIVLNLPLMLVPSVVTIVMQATRIRASMTAYSTAVGPSSLTRNRSTLDIKPCMKDSLGKPRKERLWLMLLRPELDGTHGDLFEG